MRINEVTNKGIFLNKPSENYSNSKYKFEIKTISIKDIDIRLYLTQIKELGKSNVIQRDVVQDYINDIKQGIEIPLLLVKQIKNGKYKLIDGIHRYTALLKVYPDIIALPVAIKK
jgi:ParB-like chromosome segregation protein Spo0J